MYFFKIYLFQFHFYHSNFFLLFFFIRDQPNLTFLVVRFATSHDLNEKGISRQNAPRGFAMNKFEVKL
jgi:hypothetical protein